MNTTHMLTDWPDLENFSWQQISLNTKKKLHLVLFYWLQCCSPSLGPFIKPQCKTNWLRITLSKFQDDHDQQVCFKRRAVTICHEGLCCHSGIVECWLSSIFEVAVCPKDESGTALKTFLSELTKLLSSWCEWTWWRYTLIDHCNRN